MPLFLSPRYPDTRHKAEYHPSPNWLRENNRNPAMAEAIEFTNIPIFEKECKRMPRFVLHELAHAYHHQVLGWDHPQIRDAYQAAKKAGTYNAVKNHAGHPRTAYALTPETDDFADNTEAFFGANDFYPFNKQQLKKHDPNIHNLLKKIWLEK